MIQTTGTKDRPLETSAIDEIFIGFVFPSHVMWNRLANSFCDCFILVILDKSDETKPAQLKTDKQKLT